MKRVKDSIKSMLISIFISGVVIIFCESNYFGYFRKSMVFLCPFLDGKRSIISNIFIGILCSSVIALIGYIYEYKSEIRKNDEKILYYYQYVRFNLLPQIGKENKKELFNINKNDKKLLEIRTFIKENEGELLSYYRDEEIYNFLHGYENEETDVLTCIYNPEYIRALCLLKIVCDYYSEVVISYHEIDELIKSISNRDTDICLKNIKRNYEYIEKMRKKIIDWDLIDKCRDLDSLFHFF